MGLYCCNSSNVRTKYNVYVKWYDKTDLANGAGFFNVQLLNENGAGVDGGWHDTRHNKVQGRRDWVNRQVTFKTTEQTRKVKSIYK